MTHDLRFCSVTKRFPGVVALEDVSFEVASGACHALMGENGAGKSTLGKILAGIYQPDRGHIELAGQPLRFHGPLDAQRAGIAIVHQELAFCPNLSVAENLLLGHMPRRGLWLDRKHLRREAERLLVEVGADCDPDEPLGKFSTGYIQLVQIAAALAIETKILVMDEPTSSLSVTESERLFDVIARLRAKGTTIIYVSHRMEEVFRICDSCTVLRDGEHVATLSMDQTTPDDVVRMMIGRSLEKHATHKVESSRGVERLRVESLSSVGKFHNVSFSVHAGEVLGIAGLVGSGRSEMAMAVFGLDPAATGRLFVDEKPVAIRCPRDAITHGIALVSEDRKRQGIIPDMGCDGNLTLPSLECPGKRGFFGRWLHCPWCSRKATCLRLWDAIRVGQERDVVRRYFQRLNVRAASPQTPIASLSGGNQQKVVLARWLAQESRILFLDEPTRGVDVAAKAEIHRLIDELAVAGQAIVMISSELPEILRLSDRALVMRQGRMMGIVPRSEMTQESLMQRMAGRGDQTAPIATLVH
jgi:ABC-type sugar transport system ATPase subunit